MITIDILSPVGGRTGGIENVIRAWTRKLPGDEYDIRVIHMAPGMKYLEGYNKAYSFAECMDDNINSKLTHFARNYAGFINSYGRPDICVATNWPAMCVVADTVRRALDTHFIILSWVHSDISQYQAAGLGGINEMLKADAHLCISRSNEESVKAVCPEAITYLTGNPVHMQTFVGKDPGVNTMCYVGRLQDVKRVDIILEALYRARHKWKLKIVGTGESEDELKEIVKYLGQQNQVEFMGWQDNPWESCKGASAMIAASEYEGFMLTGAEALSMGMTVISTPVDGVTDYVREGMNGYFFKYEDAIGLAGILDNIYEGKMPLCDRKICHESVEKYSEEVYFSRLKNIFDFLLKRG